jgi:hypothetical protein
MTDESTVFDAAFEYNMNGMSEESARVAASGDETKDARIAELEAALFLSRVAWKNALEVGLFPPEYGKTALELIEHHRAALKAKP